MEKVKSILLLSRIESMKKLNRSKAIYSYIINIDLDVCIYDVYNCLIKYKNEIDHYIYKKCIYFLLENIDKKNIDIVYLLIYRNNIFSYEVFLINSLFDYTLQ